MAATPDDGIATEIVQFYDEKVFSSLFTEDFGFGEFMNFGYWEEGIETPAAAGENLVRKLLERIPRKQGCVLDVACGKGASTALLMEFYPSENITGINISEKQLERCRENAAGCTFRQMDAVTRSSTMRRLMPFCAWRQLFISIRESDFSRKPIASSSLAGSWCSPTF